MKKINWKSKKTVTAVTAAAAVLFAALTGVTALTVRHLNTEPAQTTLPFAEEVTAAAEGDEVSATTAENAADAADAASTTTPAKVSGATDSKTSAESNKSTGSKTTGKTGSSANSGSASHSSGTNSKPATGSNSSSSNSKPSGGSTAKPTTTKPVTTTQPAKKEFAMTKQEIIDYATDYIVNTYHCKYNDGFGKDVPGTGYNTPTKVFRNDSVEQIKQAMRWSADATYLPNGWYKVYVEMEDEDTMRVYMFYA